MFSICPTICLYFSRQFSGFIFDFAGHQIFGAIFRTFSRREYLFFVIDTFFTYWTDGIFYELAHTMYIFVYNIYTYQIAFILVIYEYFDYCARQGVQSLTYLVGKTRTLQPGFCVGTGPSQ
jgi:hypothetical protein